jgi:hypothetical protein
MDSYEEKRRVYWNWQVVSVRYSNLDRIAGGPLIGFGSKFA